MPPTLLIRGNLKLGLHGTPSDEIPIDYITGWVKSRLYGSAEATLNNRILIIRSKTGSGKSTLMPVALFRILRSENTPIKRKFVGPGLICTQPRVLTAISLASDISSRPWNPDMVLGTTVGFQTGEITNKPPSGLLYATAGVLAAQLKNQEDYEIMDKYKFIIIDEAHERGLDSDLNLMLLRYFYQRNAGNERLPYLILTSATFDPQRYARYFNVSTDNIIDVEGMTFPIQEHWAPQGNNNYMAAAAELAMRIHMENLDDSPIQADLLIFMPGGGEMKATLEHLKRLLDRAPDGTPPFMLLSINREVVNMQGADFAAIFAPPSELPRIKGKAPLRRIIVSTVVAETGLTIDTLKYVMDCGWSRTKECYQPWNAEGIVTRPAPHSKIRQRRGRVGRLFPGEFYALYTEKTFKLLEEQQLPDIISMGPNSIFLTIVCEQQRQKMRMGERAEFLIEDIAMLDPPPPEALWYSLVGSFALGFMSTRAVLPRTAEDFDTPVAVPRDDAERGYGLTKLGLIGAKFSRTSMEGVRVLLSGYIYGVAMDDLITAVAMFGTGVNDLLVGRGRPKRGNKDTLPPESKALYAALPPFLASKIGGGHEMGVPPDSSEEFYFRTKILLCDSFIEAVLIFDAFFNKIDASDGNINIVVQWCKDVGLKFDSLMEVVYKRESIIEEMIVAGLNPFRAWESKLSKRTIDTFTEGVRAFKRCIYDGLYMKILKYNKKTSTYVTPQGMHVRTPNIFSDAMISRLNAMNATRSHNLDMLKPKFICTDTYKLNQMQGTNPDGSPMFLYTVDANLISVMDGYVTPDTTLMNVRTR